MILSKLCDYYERMLNIPTWGFAVRKVHFGLLLDPSGKLLDVLDLRSPQTGTIRPAGMVVPESVQRSCTPSPNFMCDHAEYVLGDDGNNPARALERFETFKQLHHRIGDVIVDPGMKAVLRFLDTWHPSGALQLPYHDEMSGGGNLVFKLDGDLIYVHDHSAVKAAWLKYYSRPKPGIISTCLISGRNQPIARLHPKIKGVYGAQATGGSLVSFEPHSFRFFMKTKGYNAPIGESAAFKYATALNHLLRIDSKQKTRIGDTTIVFWTERDTPFEGFMGLVFYNPNGESAELQNFLRSARDGKHYPDMDLRNMAFYILGLASSAGRISVRLWLMSTVQEMAGKLGQHFRDLLIVRNPDFDPEFPGIAQLLRAVAPAGKSEKIPPPLIGALARSVLSGGAYPRMLLALILLRFRSDRKSSGNMDYLRAAMVKAFLSRQYRITNQTKEMKMSLDKGNTNTAYQLGRLFAALEKVQRDALGKTSATIRDRFFGSAMLTPCSAFPQLLRLSQHHISKSRFGVQSDRMIEEITGGMNSFPKHLNLEDQGMFVIGYYHQRRAFFDSGPGDEPEQPQE